MKTVYRISEFAALCGVTRDTLLYYDKMGVLKPAFVAQNGYRFYTLSQFYEMDLLAILKASGTPLAQAGDYLHNPDASAGIRLLQERRKALAQERQRLLEMEQALSQTMESIREGLNCVCGKLTVQPLEREYLLVTKTDFSAPPTEQDFCEKIGEHFALCEQSGFGARFQTGEIILQQDALQGRFVESYYFNPIFEPTAQAGVWEKPAGLYAVYYYKGSYDSLKNEAYALFLKEIAQQGYQLSGDLYEDDLIDHFSTPDPAHYILKISARVTPCEGETR